MSEPLGRRRFLTRLPHVAILVLAITLIGATDTVAQALAGVAAVARAGKFVVESAVPDAGSSVNATPAAPDDAFSCRPL